MRGLFVTSKPNINYILDVLGAFSISDDRILHINRHREYLKYLICILEKSRDGILTVNFEIGTKSGTWSYLSLQS